MIYSAHSINPSNQLLLPSYTQKKKKKNEDELLSDGKKRIYK